MQLQRQRRPVGQADLKGGDAAVAPLSPHDDGHDDVQLQLPVWPGKSLGACTQHVVGQRGVQDKHKL